MSSVFKGKSKLLSFMSSVFKGKSKLLLFMSSVFKGKSKLLLFMSSIFKGKHLDYCKTYWGRKGRTDKMNSKIITPGTCPICSRCIDLRQIESSSVSHVIP